MADNSTWHERRRGEDASARWRAWDQKVNAQDWHTTSRSTSANEWHAATGVFNITIDKREIDRLLSRMSFFDLKRKDFIMVAALNRGADRMTTQVKNLLADRTGIKVKGRITRGFTKIRASGHNWSAGIAVEDRYTRITKEYYGARWNRSMPGVAHAAWNNPQMAKHAFMIPGKAPAFVRVGKGRLPLHVLFGPNMARELERNAPAVDHIATAIANWWIVPEAARLIEVEWARIGAGAASAVPAPSPPRR